MYLFFQGNDEQSALDLTFIEKDKEALKTKISNMLLEYRSDYEDILKGSTDRITSFEELLEDTLYIVDQAILGTTETLQYGKGEQHRIVVSHVVAGGPGVTILE